MTQDILIVDDILENLRLLSVMLGKQGYSVRKALNGQMALTAARTVPPDLILLDILMPGMDGYEVCQMLKAEAKTAEVPVIFLSALNETFDKVQAFRVGGADYITKPFQFEEVLARVQNQLALRASAQEVQRLNAELEKRVKERTQQLELANADLIQEVMERQRIQVQLLHMALHDVLTGLPNRALFMQRLEATLARLKADGTDQFALLFFDCDRFKVINDSLGHVTGDELLVAIAQRLKGCLSQVNILARLGGDEFAILLTSITGLPSAIQVADQILASLSQPFQLERQEVFINASIGIVLGSPDYEKPEHLLRDADTAMYRAKAMGRARHHIFDPAMYEAALQLLELETDLRRAVNQPAHQSEFVLHYQPIVDLGTGRIVGFEALVRWCHPQRGLVLPDLFVPIAEETGLIMAIGDWVIREACQQLRRWQQSGLAGDFLTMSVNLSVRQFAQPYLIEQIEHILAETQLNPRSLRLEITESAIIDNITAAATIVKNLRERQIYLSIDDFGTGYSSLSYLHSFPVNSLKIDRSFIQRLDGTPENLGLVPAITSIAQAMKLGVIAEGIETAAQLAQLRMLNCDLGQGYLFAQPLDAEEAMVLLNANPQW